LTSRETQLKLEVAQTLASAGKLSEQLDRPVFADTMNFLSHAKRLPNGRVSFCMKLAAKKK
jgi:hypothetical protein